MTSLKRSLSLFERKCVYNKCPPKRVFTVFSLLCFPRSEFRDKLKLYKISNI